MTGLNVGAIYYEIEADTSKLVNGSAQADSALDKMNKRFSQTDKAANDTSFKMTKAAQAVKGLGRESSAVSGSLQRLTKLLAGLVSIQTAVSIVQTAEAYNEMAERIRMATSSTQEYNRVQARLLENANSTYRSLSEAQEVYIRTADSLRSMGYSTEQVLDITDSLSYLFVTNAASADRASTAISAYSKAINKGKVEADAWESILAAVPSIIGDIAAASGLSAESVRALGASGKLTAKQLNEGLRQSLDKNKVATAGMATTVKDALTALKNNIAVYIGEANQATGVTGQLSSAILKIADAVKNSSIEGLVREIEALQATVEAIGTAASDWLGPFMKSTGEAADYLPTSFARAALSTAKEIDGLTNVFTGTVGAIQGLWSALANNIPAFFQNAWQDILAGSAAFVNELASMLNKPLHALGMEGLGTVEWGTGATRAIVDLTDAAQEGWDTAAKSAGAYEAIARRLSEGAINRAITSWEEEYGEAIDKTTEKKGKAIATTGKLSAAEKKLKKDQEANKKVVDELAEALMSAGLSGEQLAVAKAKIKLNSAASPAEISQVEQLAKAYWMATEAKQLLYSVDPIANEQNRFETELSNLKALNDAKLIEDQRYLDLKAQAEKEHDETLFQLQEENFRRQSEWNEILMSSLDYFQEASTNALLGLITGATDVTAAMQTLGQAIMKEVVGSFIKMGVEQVKAWVMGQAAQKVAGLAYAASVAGQVGANTALAAQATFASISAIPIVGPSMAPGWAARAAVTATALGAPAITSAAASVGGGKLYGGAVAAETMYRINETGAPEVLNLANGQQFLLPNQRGEVISNREATRRTSASSVGNGTAFSPAPIIALTLNGSWFSEKDLRRLVADLNEALGNGAVLQVRG